MKNHFFYIGIVASLFLCSLFTSCNKETENDSTDQEVSFQFNVSALQSASLLKSAMAYELSDVDKIVITIQNSDGTPTRYTASEINIQQMNGVYYSQRITLKTGAYRLTEFDLTGDDGNTIFAVPLTGSLMSQNVSTALPIPFIVNKNAFTSVPLEVLSTESHTPEDFGLSRFPITDVKTFSFLVGVADAESDSLLASKLTVSNGTYSYIQDLDTITNNIVTVRDGLASYALTIESLGYSSYSYTFTPDSLKTHRDTIGNIPLLIELERLEMPTNGLIMYYPFNGNANDESGNGYNGTVNGADNTTDRFGQADNAYSFNGSSSYINIGNICPINDISVSLWLKKISLSSTGCLLGTHDAGHSNAIFYLSINGSNQLECLSSVITQNGKAIQGIHPTLSTNWHYVTITRTGTTLTLYLDGVAIPYNVSLNQGNPNGSISTGAETGIGATISKSGVVSTFFNGSIDDIRIYNRVLNEQEIQLLYNEGK